MSLTKHQTIAFIMKSSDKVAYIYDLPKIYNQNAQQQLRWIFGTCTLLFWNILYM
jgi:hypothetical protein